MQTLNANYQLVDGTIHEELPREAGSRLPFPSKHRKLKAMNDWNQYDIDKAKGYYYEQLMQVFEDSQPHQSLAYVRQLAADLKAVPNPDGFSMSLAIKDINLIASTAYGIDLSSLQDCLSE